MFCVNAWDECNEGMSGDSKREKVRYNEQWCNAATTNRNEVSGLHAVQVECGQDEREFNVTMSNFTVQYDLSLPTYRVIIKNDAWKSVSESIRFVHYEAQQMLCLWE